MGKSFSPTRFATLLATAAIAALVMLGVFGTTAPAFADAGALTTSAVQSTLTTQAAPKWKTITTPAQLRNLHFKDKGFGPGYYRIGADFTLGENCDPDSGVVATCALLKGTYVIDFNGHAVQSAGQTLAAFTVQGANVTFLDSKASSKKVTINGLGAACIEVRSGSATILNGNYACKQFDPGGTAVYVGGGTCTINGGSYTGTVSALTNAGGTLTVNGGSFYGGYPFAYLHFDNTGKAVTKIKSGTFQGGSDAYGFPCAIGMLSLGQACNLNSLLAKGSSWSQTPTTIYYSTGSSRWGYSPTYSVGYGIVSSFTYAATADQQVTVKGTVGAQKSNAVAAPTLKSLTAGKKSLTAKWGKISGAAKYQLRYATAKSMKGAKTVNISKKSSARTVKKLKSGKRYYVQVRTFKKIGNLTYYSAWSNKKSVKVK